MLEPHQMSSERTEKTRRVEKRPETLIAGTLVIAAVMLGGHVHKVQHFLSFSHSKLRWTGKEEEITEKTYNDNLIKLQIYKN